jgi:gliding motility-associated-like protein
MWNTGDSTKAISVTQTGTYVVQIKLNGCKIKDSAHVLFKPYPIHRLRPDTTLPCYSNQVVTLNAGNTGATYFWNTGDTTQSIQATIAPGTRQYRVMINLNGCRIYDSTQVIIQALKIPHLPYDTTVCPGRWVIVNAGNPLAPHTWSNNSYNQATDTLTASGIYTVTTGLHLCAVTDTINVDTFPLPVAQLGGNQSICPYYQVINLQTNFTNAAYLWSTGSTANSITVTDSGTYWLAVHNVCGTAYDTIRITLEKNCCYIYLPNAFTPNYDGDNDVFHPVGFCDVSNFDMRLYNRWGLLIFESHHIKSGWDGTFQGKPQPQDVYFWDMNYTAINGETRHLKGDVTLLR